MFKQLYDGKLLYFKEMRRLLRFEEVKVEMTMEMEKRRWKEEEKEKEDRLFRKWNSTS